MTERAVFGQKDARFGCCVLRFGLNHESNELNECLAGQKGVGFWVLGVGFWVSAVNRVLSEHE